MNQIHYVCGLTLALFFASMSFGALTDRNVGAIPVDVFPNQQIGTDGLLARLVQDKRGRIFTGGNGLSVYDGKSWRTFRAGNAYLTIGLGFGPDGRLWAGSFGEPGVFTETASGEFLYESLRDKLRPEDRNAGTNWGVKTVGDNIYFFYAAKVLRWDGSKFDSWDFPTSTRLFPVMLGDDVWFTHSETGMYRITPDGPHLEIPVNQVLKDGAPFYMERVNGKILLGSRLGFYYADSLNKPLFSEEVTNFTKKGNLVGAVRTADGVLIIATLTGGLGIVSDGQLVRTLTRADGLPSNSIDGIFLDREGMIWLSTPASGLMRMDPRGVVSVFGNGSGRASDSLAVSQLDFADNRLYVFSDGGAFMLDSSKGKARLDLIEPWPATVRSVVPYKGGLIIGGFRSVDYFRGSRRESIIEMGATTFYRLSLSNKNPDMIYCLENRAIARFSPGAPGWKNEVLCPLTDSPPTGFYLDPDDNIWIGSQGGIWLFNTTTNKIEQVYAALTTSDASIVGFNSHVYAFHGEGAFLINRNTRQLRRIDQFPKANVRTLALSPDGRTLYILAERQTEDSSRVYSLGWLKLGVDDGKAESWTETQLPIVNLAEAANSMLVTEEDGTDTLWLGGAGGVFRVKPNELWQLGPPAPPWLQVKDKIGYVRDEGNLAVFEAEQHRITLAGFSPEINRKDQLFQFRLRQPDIDWSVPSQTSVREFTNLSDGDYVFEMRLVDFAGRTSPVTAYSFRILPPWYRSSWAYAVSGCLGILLLTGTVWIRTRVIRQQKKELEEMVQERTDDLVKANAAKDEFLASISHEIRNPLNGVVGLTDTFSVEGLDPARKQRIESIRLCATHLSGILEKVLDYSKLQAGETINSTSAVNVRELVRSIIGITASESDRVNIPVEVAIAPTVPEMIIGDAVSIRQILINYVVNALKYAGGDKVDVTVWTREPKIDSCELHFAVTDKGPGIPADECARLFSRFERGSVAKAKLVPGIGLGLATCRTLAKQMQGRVWVESTLGKGSTFRLSIPVRNRQTPSISGRSTPSLEAEGEVSVAKMVLVVDDEEYNRLAAATYLENLGLKVKMAMDGESALAAMQRDQFAAIFMDISMPGRTGLEVAVEIRSSKANDHIYLVATTAYTNPQKHADCRAAGFNAVMTKPISLEKFREVLASVKLLPPGAPKAIVAPLNDALKMLRVSAQRKGVSISDEVTWYLGTLAADREELLAGLAIKDGAATRVAAHKLVGRLGLIRATQACSIIEDIDSSIANGLWDAAAAHAGAFQAAFELMSSNLTVAAKESDALRPT